MSMSQVEVVRDNAARRAAQEAIGRQLQQEYEVACPLPEELAVLLARLTPTEGSQLAAVSAPKTGAVIVGEAAQTRRRSALLLERLRITADRLMKVIDETRETMEWSRQSRQKRHASVRFVCISSR
jgi:hypothetical protein